MKSAKSKYWLSIILSFLFSAGIPVVAIVKKFPLWKQTVSPAYTIGVGGVLVVIVLLLCLRKTVLPTIMAKLGITSTPSVVFWVGGWIVVEVVAKINTFMTDIKGIVLAGLFGSAVGWVFSLLASHYDKKSESEVKTNGED